jgi:hypothetical protein
MRGMGALAANGMRCPDRRAVTDAGQMSDWLNAYWLNHAG